MRKLYLDLRLRHQAIRGNKVTSWIRESFLSFRCACFPCSVVEM